jgi:hypothetical protein
MFSYRPTALRLDAQALVRRRQRRLGAAAPNSSTRSPYADRVTPFVSMALQAFSAARAEQYWPIVPPSWPITLCASPQRPAIR